MSNPRLSPWFMGSIVPMHEGAYKREAPAGPYSCWTQGRWWGDAATPQAAAAARRPSRLQRAAWRGLTASMEEMCRACRGGQVIDLGFDQLTGDDLIAECADCATP